MPDFDKKPEGNDVEERPYYPPPNETVLVLAATLALALIGGAFLINLGKVGAVLIESLFILPPLLYLKYRGYPIARCLRWNKISQQQVFIAVLIGLSLIVLLDEFDRIITFFFPLPAEAVTALDEFLQMESWTDYLFVWVGAVFAAAICEESLFRGFVQLSLEAYGSITKAILLGALLFAIAHFNPWWMVQILILGVFLGYLSWRANSVLPTMVIHALYNGVALLLTNTQDESEWSWYTSGDHVSLSVLIAAAALLFISMKIFHRQTEGTFPIKKDVNETAAS